MNFCDFLRFPSIFMVNVVQRFWSIFWGRIVFGYDTRTTQRRFWTVPCRVHVFALAFSSLEVINFFRFGFGRPQNRTIIFQTFFSDLVYNCDFWTCQAPKVIMIAIFWTFCIGFDAFFAIFLSAVIFSCSLFSRGRLLEVAVMKFCHFLLSFFKSV